ncbi:megakaryocyte and platelet inhibitory receptor G6b isoform X2 [Myotis lucifugus]|uniref:megakaryocyte and platelet inhibitory receptor G6b isoform X2 n=1 Tax=Myotis lucifugus TaxID=59463 RepID=UPI0006D71057|nr:megakaryocyte and platelet inhibitory receptor G6b isoform X2 [Myotis lucifugus]
MALVLQLLLLLLWRAQGDPGGKLSLGNQHERVSLDGRPGDRVNLSCVGVSQPIRWVWAPSFPACKGLPKGRRRILWASSSGTPTVSPAQPFAGRLRVLDHPGIRRLELLLSAGDSGTFICRGRQEDESHTVLHVLGDAADCRGSGPSLGSVYPQLLILLLGAGLVLGLGALGAVWWQRRRSPPRPPRPLPRPALSPSHSPTSESRAPETSKGRGAQDCGGPGPGVEPALRRPGSCGPQPALPAAPGGPC